MENEPLGDDLSYTPLALAGGLVPPALQLSAITAFLAVAHPDPFQTLGAIILSLIWLRGTEGQLVADYAGQRERAKLFGQVGEWLGYPRRLGTVDLSDEKEAALASYFGSDRCIYGYQ